jgi:hypothetical protein
VKTLQLTKKQVQVLDECIQIELGSTIGVSADADTAFLKKLHEMLENLLKEVINEENKVKEVGAS